MQVVEARVRELVDDVLRPLVEADGGTIDLVAVSGERVVVRLGAACAGCPGIHYTREHVVVPALRTVVGESVHVEVERAPSKPR